MGLDKPEAVNKINLLTHLLRLKLMEIHSYLQSLLLQPENIVYVKSEINQYLSLDIYLDIIMGMFPFQIVLNHSWFGKLRVGYCCFLKSSCSIDIVIHPFECIPSWITFTVSQLFGYQYLNSCCWGWTATFLHTGYFIRDDIFNSNETAKYRMGNVADNVSASVKVMTWQWVGNKALFNTDPDVGCHMASLSHNELSASQCG